MNDFDVRILSAPLQIETRDAEGNSKNVVSGYAALYDSWSEPLGWFKERIERGAFDNCDFSDCSALFNHNSDNMLARTLSKTLILTVDEKGLKFEFEMPNTTLGNDLKELIARGDIRACSFCFGDIISEWSSFENEDENRLDERVIESIGYVRDISLVTNPAYTETDVSLRSKEQFEQQKTPINFDDRQRELDILNLK